MIADNRLTENSTWDDRLLAEQLKELSELELEFSVEATGFEMGEIDLRIEGLGEAEEGEDLGNQIPEPGGPSVSRTGDLWELGHHRIFCGSALEGNTYATLLGAEK